MMKWIKRLLLYPFAVLIIAISLYFLYNKDLYYTLKGFSGSQLQWFGYEELGNSLIGNAIVKLKNIDSELYRAYSIQNTKNGNYDEAIKYLNEASNLDSENTDGYFGWILLYYYRDYDRALFYLERFDSSTASVDYVGDDNIIYAKALCYKLKGSYHEALALFKKSIDYEINTHGEQWVHHQMYFQTGRTLQLLDRNEEAIAFYDRAIENWDGSSESIYYKGLAELELGIDTGCANLELALERVRKGIKSTDTYVRLFDEIYVGQVEEMIELECM